jgi:hypothetical protein
MLINTVGSIAGAVGKYWDGVLTTCHFGTVFWLFEDLYDRPPANNTEYLKFFPNPSGVMDSMLPLSRVLTRPPFGNLNLTPGNILIFSTNGVNAGHSCVALKPDLIGGYNQMGWFQSPLPIDHAYSVHNTSEIVWKGTKFPNEILRPSLPTSYKLYAVDENTAKNKIREIVEKIGL